MENKYIINTCYILGTTLLQINKVSYFQIELIKEELLKKNKNYIVDIGTDNTMTVIDEWRDFFMTDENNDILLTDNSVNARNTVSLLFSSVLPTNIQLDLLNSIEQIKTKKYLKLIK